MVVPTPPAQPFLEASHGWRQGRTLGGEQLSIEKLGGALQTVVVPTASIHRLRVGSESLDELGGAVVMVWSLHTMVPTVSTHRLHIGSVGGAGALVWRLAPLTVVPIAPIHP